MPNFGHFSTFENELYPLQRFIMKKMGPNFFQISTKKTFTTLEIFTIGFHKVAKR